MSTVYITKSNFFSILSLLENEESDYNPNRWDLYKWKISLLNKHDIMNFQKMKNLLQNPEGALAKYKRKEKKDNLKYVFEGGSPSYHLDKDCTKLISKFNNYEIPLEIRDKGKSEIDKFRVWFKDNYKFLLEKPDLFAAKLQIAFGLSNIPKIIEMENSGIAEMENLDLVELEKRIDNILVLCKKFYNDNPDRQQILDRFKKYTYLSNSNEEIINNDTNLTDTELKSFLKEYDIKFKKPLKELLLHYYMIKYNPNLEFDGHLLEQLGFRQCTHCC